MMPRAGKIVGGFWDESVVKTCNDPVNNCTRNFDPEMGDDHDARIRNQAMDCQA